MSQLQENNYEDRIRRHTSSFDSPCYILRYTMKTTENYENNLMKMGILILIP